MAAETIAAAVKVGGFSATHRKYRKTQKQYRRGVTIKYHFKHLAQISTPPGSTSVSSQIIMAHRRISSIISPSAEDSLGRAIVAADTVTVAALVESDDTARGILHRFG